jgi:hypothetical protein
MNAGKPFDRKDRGYPRHGGKGFDLKGCSLARIVSIEVEPEEPVYDLEVSGTHSFIADGVVVHNSNIEHQSIEFSTIHLNPWLVRFEQAVQPQLDDGYFSQFARDSIIRGDISSRYDAYSKGLQGRPFLLPNDVRRLESLPPVEGWDDPAEPLNMAPAGQTGRQGEQRPEQVAEPEEEEEEEQARDIRPLIEAATKRIVNREIISLRKRAANAEKDRNLFNAWIGEWYAKHASVVMAILEPVCQAASVQIDAKFGAEYCESEARKICESSDVVKLLTEWDNNKQGQMANELRRLLCTQTS